LKSNRSRGFDGNTFAMAGLFSRVADAVFGAPTALEDHAIRACLAALAIQEEAERLAVDVRERDGVELLLRVGLNSGQVIAGEIGSGPFGYTAVGEQVGMAQRMESVAGW
jgi:adenylate cyclase